MKALLGQTKNLLQRSLPLHNLNRDLKILFVSNIVASFGDGLTIYLLPLFIRNLNATPEDVGFLFSVLTLASATTIIPGGLLADRYDRKKIMILGWAVWIPVPLLFAFAAEWTQLPPAMFLYGILLSGPASSIYIVERAQEERITSTFTILVSAWGIGYTFAPTIAGYLTEAVGMHPVFLLTTLSYFITLVLLTRISSQHPPKGRLSSPTTQEPSYASTSRLRRILLLTALLASAMFVLSLIFPLVPQFLNDVQGYNVAQIGILGSFTYLGGAILSPMVGRLGDKYGKTTSISAAMVLVGLALWMFTSVSNFLVLIVASFLRGASFPMWSFIGAIIGSIAPPMSRGRWISLVQTATQVVGIMAPYVGGILYSTSPRTPFLIAIAASLVLSLLALTKPFRSRPL